VTNSHRHRLVDGEPEAGLERQSKTSVRVAAGLRGVAVLGAAVLGGACLLSPIPDRTTVLDRAHALDVKCRGRVDPGAALLLAPAAIDSVEPSYVYVPSGPVSPEARLRGARLHVRPAPGVSQESLARGLECHEAAVVLGAASASADDPFVAEGRWVEVLVASEGDGFVVDVRASELPVAKAVLARARAYARGGAPQRASAASAFDAASLPVEVTPANAHASTLDGSAEQIDRAPPLHPVAQ
jgi:hypothetical protein